MKNKLNALVVLSLIIWLSLGCGIIESVQKTVTETPASNSDQTTTSPDSNKSTADRTIEQLADGETTGVPECDQVIKILTDQLNSPDDNWATKATKDYVFGQIKKSLRESLEQNKNDKVKLAEQCRDYKTQLDKQLKAEQEKQQ